MKQENVPHQKLQPSYYAILPAGIRYDRNLNSTEKLLYAEITALSDREGYCWASNSYFAETLDKLPAYISQVLTKLSKKGYITVEVERNKKGTFRKIYIGGGIEKSITGVANKLEGGIEITAEGYRNNYIQKNTIKNNIKEHKEIEIDKSISKESEETENEIENETSEKTETQNQNEQKEGEETETTEEHSADRQALLLPTKLGVTEAVKPLQPPNSKKLLKPHRQSKKQSLQSDPNFHHFLEIANRIKTLIESQKRITISNQQVLAWTIEINKLYKTLESARGDKDAIHSMFLMINTLKADTGYEDKYKPVIESGKSFREKFIKIEDYYRRRQIEYNKRLQEEDFII